MLGLNATNAVACMNGKLLYETFVLSQFPL
jgi:hypothetical protein